MLSFLIDTQILIKISYILETPVRIGSMKCTFLGNYSTNKKTMPQILSVLCHTFY